MGTCNCCGQSKSPFILNNKTVCLRCDELLFDIEIELEEAGRALRPTEPVRTAQAPAPDKKFSG